MKGKLVPKGTGKKSVGKGRIVTKTKTSTPKKTTGSKYASVSRKKA